MKKITVLVAMLVGLSMVSISNAGISIAMINTSDIFLNNGSTFLPSSSLVQLVWSFDNPTVSSFATPVTTQIPGTGTQYANGDYVLFSGLTTETDGWSGDLDGASTVYTDLQVGSLNINAGYVYMMVFQSAAPLSSEYYAHSGAIGPNLTVFPNSPTPTPDTLDINSGAGALTLNSQVQAVPEPSTVGLLLVGAGLVALRRIRRG